MTLSSAKIVPHCNNNKNVGVGLFLVHYRALGGASSPPQLIIIPWTHNLIHMCMRMCMCMHDECACYVHTYVYLECAWAERGMYHYLSLITHHPSLMYITVHARLTPLPHVHQYVHSALARLELGPTHKHQ